MTIQSFKTDRIYDFPQVIKYQVEADCILFADHSRGIFGALNLPRYAKGSTLNDYVLRTYDEGDYKWSPASRDFYDATKTKG